MHPNFEVISVRWLQRAFNYTGNIGDFRYRFLMDKDNQLIHAATYTVYCYESATDKSEQDFPWTDEGVEQLKLWLQAALDAFEGRKTDHQVIYFPENATGCGI